MTAKCAKCGGWRTRLYKCVVCGLRGCGCCLYASMRAKGRVCHGDCHKKALITASTERTRGET